MPKRKHNQDFAVAANDEGSSEQEFSSLEESSSDNDEDVPCFFPCEQGANQLTLAKEYDELAAEFEWFDPQPQDFEGFKRLLKQLFGPDASLFHLGAVADLILEQCLLGSTVKTDSHQGDPHALLTVLNLKQHRTKPVIKAIVDYLVKRASTNSDLSPLRTILAANNGNEVGLILSSRWVNIPTEVVPANYELLLQEIEWAIKDNEPYMFSHYLVWSRVYIAVPSTLDEDTNRPMKKLKPESSEDIEDGRTLYYFHPEDEILHRYAMLYGRFDYATAKPEGDCKNSFQDFGITTHGHLILIEAAALKSAVEALRVEYPGAPTIS
ncbi:MAG: hypothetical protein Q9166_006615 [cf. Caloplaca sp. 2 TL-2023]